MSDRSSSTKGAHVLSQRGPVRPGMADPTPQGRIEAPLRRRLSRTFLLGAILLALVALAPPGEAHISSEHGMITVHNSEDGPATETIECQFWVRGEGMSADNGTISAAHQLGGPSAHSHSLGAWTGTPDGNGTFSFLAGPFTLHDSGDDWEIHVSVVAAEGSHGVPAAFLDYTACIVCPHDLALEVLPDGPIRLEWTGTEEADIYVIDRREFEEFGFGAREEIARTEETTFTDTTTLPGETYQYFVMANGTDEAGQHEVSCGSAQATAIPYFGAIGGVLASAGVIAAYAVLRRRRD